jgi:hypothetical protein
MQSPRSGEARGCRDRIVTSGVGQGGARRVRHGRSLVEGSHRQGFTRAYTTASGMEEPEAV